MRWVSGPVRDEDFYVNYDYEIGGGASNEVGCNEWILQPVVRLVFSIKIKVFYLTLSVEFAGCSVQCTVKQFKGWVERRSGVVVLILFTGPHPKYG